MTKTLKLLGKVLQRGGYRAGLTVNGFSAVNLLGALDPIYPLGFADALHGRFQLLELLKQYQSSSEIR